MRGATRLAELTLIAVALLLGGMALARAQGADNACHPAIDPAVKQYVVGYGSLMEEESKRRTAPDTGPNRPVAVDGYRRAWKARGESVGYSTTYLGVEPEAGAWMVAALYRVLTQAEIAAHDKREAFYCRRLVDPVALRTLDGLSVPKTAQFWIYVTQPAYAKPPSAEYPIVQSYVDIVLTGCLELSDKVRESENLNFAEACIATTDAWSTHWVNDRLYPRRPFIYRPTAGRIDRLLAGAEKTRALFEGVEIE